VPRFGRCASGNGDAHIVVRIKADAPVLRPDAAVPANPIL